MAHENKVIQSINDQNGLQCVDIFVRTDGSYGFQHCRRDPEDGRGWSVIGPYSNAEFSSLDGATISAQKLIEWMPD